MTERADQVSGFIEPHSIKMNIVRRVRLLIRKIVAPGIPFYYRVTVQFRIINALPVPDYFSVIHFLQIGIHNLRSLRIARDVIHFVVEITRQDIMIQIDQQKVVPVQRSSFG